MSFIGLVSDSSAGLSLGFAERHHARTVPLYIHMQGATHRDQYDIVPEAFYDRLPQCDPLPTTSQPSAGDFATVYGELIAQGAEAIISVHISSGLSGTVNSAQLAAQQFEGFPIEIVDTRYASAPHLLAVEKGIAMLESGSGLADTVAAIRRVLESQRLVFAVDTLEYLYKGGRIGGAAALLGSLLQFKPLLCFKDGRIDALERVRTSNRALTRMAEVMREWLGVEEPMQAVIIEAKATDRAQALKEILPQYVNVAAVRIWPLPPVLGAHVGNGTVGLCCCPISACGMPPEDAMSFA
jgi:DegV family protein with EDD domain